jgi:hypothetical protein
MRLYILFLAGLMLFSCNITQKRVSDTGNRIKPWEANPRYWQYKGQPVLLLGGTVSNNIFRSGMEAHLDSLKAIGGNYIRVTMAIGGRLGGMFAGMTDDGKYDLNQWNDEYWGQFEHVLKLSHERDIIVQVEVWDRFNHSRQSWDHSPYNPGNNINYTYEETGLDSIYPLHPGANVQPFFFTVPELDNNKILLKFQEAFADKLLSISLEYDNVLYCIDNETSGTEEWATYWAEFIRGNSRGKDIYVTQMWDAWDVTTQTHKRTLDHPELYGYIDISQNSQIPGRPNWDNAQYVFSYTEDNPRPVNSTKIYGSDHHEPWLHRGMTTEHAIQTFCRNVLGGFASSRFHRPSHGLGLSPPSINTIKTIRKIEEYVKMWEINPAMDLLRGAEGNRAYLSARAGEIYVVYFVAGRKVGLDLTGQQGEFVVRWITTDDAEWGPTEKIKGGGIVDLVPHAEKSCFAVLTKR